MYMLERKQTVAKVSDCVVFLHPLRRASSLVRRPLKSKEYRRKSTCTAQTQGTSRMVLHLQEGFGSDAESCSDHRQSLP